ncbi:MAG: glycosyltransferase [Aurantibacter sp.]
MKILIVLPNDSLGGAEQYLKMVANYHKRDKVEILFLRKVGSDKWNDVSNSITKTYLHQTSYNLGILSFIKRLLFKKRTRYDRIYSSHIYITGLLGILISFGLLKKTHFIARESTSNFTRFKGAKLRKYKMTYALGYRHIDLLICQTDFMREQLLKGFPKIKKRTEVIVLENPIDISLIRSKENGPFEYEPPEKFIVSAGRLIPEKGFDILIGAFAAVKDDFPDVELLILGEGDERENLTLLAKNYDVENRVHMPGNVNNVYPYFKKAALCVVSSRIEGFPNVLLQMMSQNNDVLSTLCAGGIENIEGVVTIPADSKGHLTESMRTTLLRDTAQNRQSFDSFLGKRGIDNFMTTLQNNLR